MTNKKKVVVVGNCQARPIAALLEAMSDEIEVTKVAIVHLLQNDQEQEYAPFFEDADVIIAQLVAPNYPCEFVRTELLENSYSNKLVKIVNLFCYADTPYLRNLPKKLRGVESPFGDYHFPTVFECWEKGEDINTAVLALNKQGSTAKQTDSYDELAVRELQADVAIVDYIKNSKQRLFHTFNHPCNSLLLEYSRRILNCLNIKEKKSSYHSTGDFLGQFVPFFINDDGCQHKLTKNKKAIIKTSQELVSEFYCFYQKNAIYEDDKENVIPKVIVQYWDGELPYEIKHLTDSWKKNNPEYKYKIFNHKQALQFIKENYGEKEAALFLKAKLPAMQSDIFRVAYCLNKGGLYIDAATNCNKSLSSLFNASHTLQVMRKWHGGVWNGFILSPSNNSVLAEIWSTIIYNLEHEVGDNIWSVTGPGLFNQFCENAKNVSIMPQNEIGEYFSLVNNLEHKKGNHWSTVQKETSIYVTQENLIKPKIIFHLGPFDISSHNYQKILENNESYLKNENIALITPRSSFSESYKLLRNDYTRALQASLLLNITDRDLENTTKNLVEILNAIVEEVVLKLPNTEMVIFSDANLIGPITGHFFARNTGRELGFYSMHKLVFKSLNLAFGVQLERVILSMQGCESFIISSYRNYISKMIRPESFEHFKNSLNTEIYHEYDELYKNAKLILGDKVHELDFDISINEIITNINESLKIKAIKESNIKADFNSTISERGLEVALEVIPKLQSVEEMESLRVFIKDIK